MRMILLAGLLLGGVAVQANTLSLNTGQSGTIGTFSDPHWTIVSAPSGTGLNSSGAAFIEENSYPPNSSGLIWPATAPGANYISAGDCGRQFYMASCGAGNYIFAISFSSFGPGATISFQVAGDNRVQVFLNSLSSPSLRDYGDSGSTGWTTLSPVTTATPLDGLNTLYLKVINDGSYTGGLLVGTLSGPQESFTPEPATYMLLGSALGGLGLLRRYRNRSR